MTLSKMDDMWKILSEYNFEIESNSTNEEVICTLCKKLINDAVYSTVCGCSYCLKCFNEYAIDEHRICPGSKDYCKDEPIVFGRNVMRSALLNKNIAKVKVKCPNEECSVNIELIEMSNHLRLCMKQPTRCPYVPIGCNTANVNLDTILGHIHSNALTHSELLIELMQNLKNEFDVIKNDFEKIKIENVSLKEELREARTEIEIKINYETETLKTEMRDQTKEIERLTKEVIDLRADSQIESERSKLKIKFLIKESEKKENRMVSLEEQLREVRKEMDVRVKGERDERERRLNDQRRQIDDAMRMEVNEIREERTKSEEKMERKIIHWIKCYELCPNIYGDFIWRIDRCSKNINTRRESESFHKNDYKLCLSMIIYSDDNIGLRCWIMRGDNDDRVTWPMKHTVTLSIIDQDTMEAYKSITRQCTFDKPNKDSDDYVGSSILKYTSIKDNPSIITNDSIVVSCLISDR